MSRFKKLISKKLSCTISSDGKRAKIVNNEKMPELKNYEKMYGKTKKKQLGLTRAERVFNDDFSFWIALKAVTGMEFEIAEVPQGATFFEGKIHSCQLTADEKVKILD